MYWLVILAVANPDVPPLAKHRIQREENTLKFMGLWTQKVLKPEKPGEHKVVLPPLEPSLDETPWQWNTYCYDNHRESVLKAY